MLVAIWMHCYVFRTITSLQLFNPIMPPSTNGLVSPLDTQLVYERLQGAAEHVEVRAGAVIMGTVDSNFLPKSLGMRDMHWL